MGKTYANFLITLSHPSSRDITLFYRTAQIVGTDGALLTDSAIAGSDYESTYEEKEVTLVIAAGATSATVPIQIKKDLLDEYDEQFSLRVRVDPQTSARLATLLNGDARATIVDDDPLPYVQFTTGTVATSEGHAGNTIVPLTVKLSAVSGREVTVVVSTARGTAIETTTAAGDPADFVDLFMTLVFKPGETEKVVNVEVIGDTRDEAATEDFYVNLLTPVNAQTGSTEANANHVVVTIADDDAGADAGPWYVEFSRTAYEVTEGSSIAITLVRAEGSLEPVAVFWTLGGTATSVADYTSSWDLGTHGRRGIVRFGPSESIKTFTITTTQDGIYEGDETVQLFVANPKGGAVRGVNKTSTLTIRDADPLPVVSITYLDSLGNVATPLAKEGKSLLYTVSVSGASTLPVSVDWTTVNDTAIATSDYTAKSGTLVFVYDAVKGFVSQTLQIDLVDDADAEAEETFKVRLDNAINASFSSTSPLSLGLRVMPGVGVLTPLVVVSSSIDGYIEDNDTVAVTSRVFYDTNGNGFLDAEGDYGLSAIFVTATDPQSGALLTGSTDVDGYVTFQLTLGTSSFAVSETDSDLPEGATVTTGSFDFEVVVVAGANAPDVGLTAALVGAVPVGSTGNAGVGLDDTVYGGPGNDTINGGGGKDWLFGGHWIGPGNACSGVPYSANLIRESAGAGRFYVDPATIIADGSIGDHVFLDADGNGHRNGESGVAGVQVNLFDADWQWVASTWTDAVGHYAFNKLTHGTYYVQFIPLPGYQFTQQKNATPANVTNDSDPDELTGLTAAIVVDSATPIQTIDAGLKLISNTSAGPWAVYFSSTVFSVRESTGFATIPVWRVAASREPVGVFRVGGGVTTLEINGDAPVTSATTADYLVVTGLLRFGSSETQRMFVVPVIVDGWVEGPESVQLFLFNPKGGAVTGTPSVATLLIFDDVCPDNDVIDGEEGDDVLLGDYGYYDPSLADPFVQLGGMGNDTLLGGEGADKLYGEGGDDVLEGGAGDDSVLAGGSGNDTYRWDGDVSQGSDVVLEDAAPAGGIDTIDLSRTTASVTLNLALGGTTTIGGLTLTLPAGNIENVSAGSGNDVLIGNDANNVLIGNGGDDQLTGGRGDDSLDGGSGNDTYLFNASTNLGHDHIYESANTGTDLIDFLGTDALHPVTLDLNLSTDQIVNGNLTLTLHTVDVEANQQLLYLGDTIIVVARVSLLPVTPKESGIENLFGSVGADVLTGNLRDNVIWGREGSDQLDGGASGYDTLKENRAGNWTLTNGTLSLVSAGETDTFTTGTFDEIQLTGDDTANRLDASSFGGLVRLFGNGGDDVLKGGTGTNYLDGGAGNDTIFANGISNFLTGGLGLDTIVGSTVVGAVDTLIETRDANLTLTDTQLRVFGVKEDTLSSIEVAVLTGGIGNNTMDASTFHGVVTLDGGAGNDRLIGTAGNDHLTGGAGDDILAGGLGDDVYLFDPDTALGLDLLIERTGEGTDTLDFQAATAVGVTLALDTELRQEVAAGLSLILSDGDASKHLDTFENIEGGQSSDVLRGNTLINVINGRDGNDVITGAGGNDVLTGGEGVGPDGAAYVDRLIEARDILLMVLTPTAFLAGTEVDTLVGFETATLVGGPSANFITATSFLGSVTLIGGGGNDQLRGGVGDDVLIGGAGDDDLRGGLGNDVYSFNAGVPLGSDIIRESIDGGEDTLNFSETTTLAITVALNSGVAQTITVNLTITLDDADGNAATQADVIENVIGGGGNDVITGNSLSNHLQGGEGDDTLEGLAGDDILEGGNGGDVYLFDLDNQLGSDTVVEALDVAGVDRLDFSSSTTGVGDVTTSLNLGQGSAQSLPGGNLTLSLPLCHTIEDFTGGAGADYVIGNALNNTLRGGEGADVLIGGLGDDTLLGERGADDLSGSEGNDTLKGGDGADTLRGQEHDDVLLGGEGKDTLEGGDGNDSLTGGAGNDVLIGGNGDDLYLFANAWGQDTLTESLGSGNDTVDFSSVNALGITITLNAESLAISGVDSVSLVELGVENWTGSSLADSFCVTPSALMEWHLTGGNPTTGPPGGDSLVYDDLSLTTTTLTGELVSGTLLPVFFLGMESLVINTCLPEI